MLGILLLSLVALSLSEQTLCMMQNFVLFIDLVWAQCPPNITSIFFVRDRTINVPLTEPVCLACRFFGDGGDLITFSDGVWRKGSNPGTVLNDGDFNGNVSISSTSNTIFLTLGYPDAVVDAGDTLTCSSSTASQQNIITIGDFSKFKMLNCSDVHCA